jgi:hypothetical protein
MWPDMHTHNDKRQTEKHLPKHPTNTERCLKRNVLSRMEKQTQKQTQRRGKNKNKLPKCTAGKKPFILNEEADCNSVGRICKRRIEDGNELHYDDCKIEYGNELHYDD